MKIENNKYVAVTYNLIVGEAEGDATVMESATAKLHKGHLRKK